MRQDFSPSAAVSSSANSIASIATPAPIALLHLEPEDLGSFTPVEHLDDSLAR
jgi:hypothetical protein